MAPSSTTQGSFKLWGFRPAESDWAANHPPKSKGGGYEVTLRITFHSRFLVDRLHGSKQILLTTRGPVFGGPGFGMVVACIISGSMMVVAWLLLLWLQLRWSEGAAVEATGAGKRKKLQ